MKTWVALKDNVKFAKILWTITEPCLNREFQQEELKNLHTLRIFVFLHGLMIWKVMQRNVWSDIVSWQTRRLNNAAKYLLHASMTTTSKKKKWNLLENCQIHALKLFWNACTWHVLEDLIFYVLWTNLQVPSQNGPTPVTNAWIDWYLACITQVNTNNIVMWEILLSNAAGTVSRLRFCRRSWGLKIHFWRNVMCFWKSYICSN